MIFKTKCYYYGRKIKSNNDDPKKFSTYIYYLFKKKYIVLFIVLLSILATSFYLNRITYLYSVSLNVTNSIDYKSRNNFSKVGGHLLKQLD